MSTEVTLPETMIARRLYTSNVVHFIDTTAPKHPDHSHHSSLCGVRPIWPGVWVELDVEFAGTMCGTCESVTEAFERVIDA